MLSETSFNRLKGRAESFPYDQMFDLNSAVATKLIALRKKYRLSYKDCAELIGTHPDVYRRYEQMEIAVPIYVLMKLMYIYNISLEEFLKK